MESGKSSMLGEHHGDITEILRQIAYEADCAWYLRGECSTMFDGISSLVQLDESLFPKREAELAKKPMGSEDEDEYEVFLLYHDPMSPSLDDPTSDMDIDSWEDSTLHREILEKQRMNKARFREVARFGEEVAGSKRGYILGVEKTAEQMDELQLR